MPKICGRKATSLTSFLFLYPLLIAIVRRLVVAKRLFAMEENNRPANNEERNIFYEYFSELERKENYNAVPTTEELDKVFADFQKINDDILLTVEECYKDVLMSQGTIFSRTKRIRNIYQYVENNSIPQYKNAVYGCFYTFKNFFNQFAATKQNGVKSIIKILDTLISLTNQELQFTIGGVKALCNISNIIEWIYAVISNRKKNCNEAILFSIGCQILKLDKYSFCKYIYKDLNRCRKALKPKNVCRTVFEDIIPLIKQFNLRKVSTSIPPYNEFVKYFIIADCAYTKAVKFKIHPKQQLLSQEGWYSPKVKYLIDDNKFYFNNMVYGIVVDNYIDEIAFGFGGTEICNRPLTIQIDASQIANVSPGYVYAVGLAQHIRTCTPDKNIVICGHSLGGGLAQFATATQDYRVKAYCYNSAGLFNNTYKKIKTHKNFNNVNHYRLEWDYVSCFGKLLNVVYTAKSTRIVCLNHGREAIKKSLGL